MLSSEVTAGREGKGSAGLNGSPIAGDFFVQPDPAGTNAEDFILRRLRALTTRLVLAALLSATVAALAAPYALAWATSYTCTATFWICVSENDDNTTPRAVTGLSDDTYVGNVYPNSQVGLNDTVSSVRNFSANKDVTFHHDFNNSGVSYCLDSGQRNDNLGSLGIGNDDHFSSHQAGSDDSAC